jgi:mannose-6-phosphate isomerase class I
MEGKGPSLSFPETGPSIIIVTKGNLIVNDGNESRILNQGESAFIPARDRAEEIMFSGNYTLYAASVGDLS